MAVPRKLVVVPNSATRELWLIAETGEMEELEAVLARADINARNEHGMTALMRAAYHGHVQMVRFLLEQGADPNVIRNDNFTALSLAAFFGHGEIVDILLSHGAKTDVATRFGTSPYTWAKARSFGDVARSLEKRNEQRKERVVTKPVARPRVAEPEPVPLAVRKLKDPPEIWDLVQEAPRNFNARAAFMARMGSVKAGLTVALALMVVIGGGAGAMFYFKKQVPVGSTPVPAAATVAVPAPVVHQTPDSTDVLPETHAVATESPNPELNANPNFHAIPRRSRPFPTRRDVQPEINNEQTGVETAVGSPVAAPVVVQVKPEPRSSVASDTKQRTAPLGSQMISPKTPQTKGKVIQWP